MPRKMSQQAEREAEALHRLDRAFRDWAQTHGHRIPVDINEAYAAFFVPLESHRSVLLIGLPTGNPWKMIVKPWLLRQGLAEDRALRPMADDNDAKMRVIHGRFVRLFLENKAEAGVADLSDQQVIEQAPAIFERLDTACQEAARKGDGATLVRLGWFTEACHQEFDETEHALPTRPPQH
jgi:hypothetical protein